MSRDAVGARKARFQPKTRQIPVDRAVALANRWSNQPTDRWASRLPVYGLFSFPFCAYHQKTIEIIVSPTGETTVNTKGFIGSSCQDASKFIEQALGQRTNERLTAEFHQAQPAGVQQQQQA